MNSELLRAAGRSTIVYEGGENLLAPYASGAVPVDAGADTLHDRHHASFST